MTPTPQPTILAPTLVQPEDRAPFNGPEALIELAWQSDHTLAADEFYEATVRYTQMGAEVRLPVRVQTPSWFVDRSLLGAADQQTGRAYHWSVRIVREVTGADGEVSYLPISLRSVEWTFYWLP